MPTIAEQVAELIDRLDRSGWAMGDFADINSSDGLVWRVVGVHVIRKDAIKVEAECQLAAWKEAESRARDLGLLVE